MPVRLTQPRGIQTTARNAFHSKASSVCSLSDTPTVKAAFVRKLASVLKGPSFVLCLTD